VAGTWIPSRRVDRSREIFKHCWPSLVDRTQTGSPPHDTLLPSGNYEWPFELVIDGTMVETVEGLPNSHITYTLEAVVMRGKVGYDLHTQKPVRIFRTLGPASLELAHPMTVEGLWPDKIEYQVVLPRKGVIFGTEIVILVRTTPLLKGLRVGTLRCILFEYQEFTLLDAIIEPGLQRVRVVDSWEFESDNEINTSRQDGSTLERVIPLPKRLSKCVPDVDVCGIKLRHRIRVDLDLRNPNGHISQVSSPNIAAAYLQG
jgi:arrestin-related trafficking adapter 4/5/7